MQPDQFELDQLIQIINPARPQKQPRRTLPPIDQKLRIDSATIAKPSFLVFKPWSGALPVSEHYASEPIREEIQNCQQQSQYQEEKEDYMLESKTFNPSSGNQMGYLYKFQTGKVRLIKCLLDENGFKDSSPSSKNWTICWSSSPFKMDSYRSMMPYQKMNHFPNSFHITRKDLMNKAVSKMQLKFGISHYNFLPKTYILPQEMDQLLAEYTKHPEVYIVKPHNRSQGKGITVTNNLEVIQSKLQKYSSLIVSHYISNPLLINRLKFDLRIYVAITGINPLRIYVYEEGLARFATQEYDPTAYDSENKKYQHLTNYSINKKNEQFVFAASRDDEYYGSKWSLTAMRDFLAYNVGKNQTNQLFDRIDQVIVKTLLSVENLIYTSFMTNVPYINGCFQVLGFDIMVDSNLKPWLIEVNHSPSMNTDSPLDLKIKGNMIADLLTMTGFTPLNDRYLDGGHSKFQSRHYFKSDDRKSNQPLIDKFILKQVQLEYERRGSWRRVFPQIKTLKFKTYFEQDRYYNRLLRQKLLPEEYHSVPAPVKPIIRTSTAEKPTTAKRISLIRASTSKQKNSQNISLIRPKLSKVGH